MAGLPFYWFGLYILTVRDSENWPMFRDVLGDVISREEFVFQVGDYVVMKRVPTVVFETHWFSNKSW